MCKLLVRKCKERGYEPVGDAYELPKLRMVVSKACAALLQPAAAVVGEHAQYHCNSTGCSTLWELLG